jgi:hypothetical protein
MPFLYGVRNTVIRDKTRTRLYKEPRKDRWSRKDDGRAWNATMAQGPRRNLAATSEEGEDNW